MRRLRALSQSERVLDIDAAVADPVLSVFVWPDRISTAAPRHSSHAKTGIHLSATLLGIELQVEHAG